MSSKKRERARAFYREFEPYEMDLKLSLESDRGCVLVAATAIEEALENRLRAFFKGTGDRQDPREIDSLIAFFLDRDPLPPLGNFGVKIRLCYLLGLIDDAQYTQLKAMVKLRNLFAHFAEPVEITADDIESFTDPDKWGENLREVYEFGPQWGASSSEARRRFILIAVLLRMSLLGARSEKDVNQSDHPFAWWLPPP